MVRTLEGHTDRVNSVAFNHNGTKVVSGSVDKTIKIWKAATGRLEQTLSGHTGTVWSVAFNHNGTKVVSGSVDNTIKIWNVAGEVEQTLNGHTSWVNSVAFNDDGTKVVSGSEDKTVKVWDAATGEVEQTLNGHTEAVSSVEFSPDGKYIVSGSEDKTIKVWDVAGEMEQTFRGHTRWVNSVAFSPDGKYIASGSDDNTIKIWDTLPIFFPFMKDYEKYKQSEGYEQIKVLDRRDDRVIVEVHVKNYPLFLEVTVYKNRYVAERPGDNLSLEYIIGKEKCEKIKNQEYETIGKMIDDIYVQEMLDSNVAAAQGTKRKRELKLKF